MCVCIYILVHLVGEKPRTVLILLWFTITECMCEKLAVCFPPTGKKHFRDFNFTYNNCICVILCLLDEFFLTGEKRPYIIHLSNGHKT